MKKLFFRIVAIFIIGAGLLFALPTPSPAAGVPAYINLAQIDGSAALPFHVTNVAPGDSGVNTVVVTNTSGYAGDITIWLSNIQGTEATPLSLGIPPTTGGDLKDDLQFVISGPQVTTNVPDWTTLNNMPQDPNNTSRVIAVNNLAAGNSATLAWGWRLPYTVGNAAQGDSVSFDINYGITQVVAPPSGGGGGGGIISPPTTTPAPTTSAIPTPSTEPTPTPPPGNTAGERIIQLNVPQQSDTSGVTDQGVVIGGLQASTPDKKFSLSITAGTTVQTSNENRQDQVDLNAIGDHVPAKIDVTTPDIQTLPPFPDPWFPVSPAYDINGITNGVITGVKLDQPAVMVIQYDENELPQIVDGLALFYYNYLIGWVQLDPPTGFIAEGPEVAAQVDHFSLFVVLARGGGSVVHPPANFVVQTLSVDPPRILVGQSSDVRVTVSNTGGMPGEYVVVVKMDGKVQKTQSVKLNPGQSTEVDFILTPLTAGVYSVTTALLKDGLVVNPLIVPDVSETNYWWLLFIAMGVATLLFTFSRRKKKVPGIYTQSGKPIDFDYIGRITKDHNKAD